MSDILEERYEQVMEITIQVPVDIYRYVVELSKKLGCSDREAIIYLFDVAIETLENTQEEEQEEKTEDNLNIDKIKNMFDMDD